MALSLVLLEKYFLLNHQYQKKKIKQSNYQKGKWNELSSELLLLKQKIPFQNNAYMKLKELQELQREKTMSQRRN